jgi:hypothetical protein
VVRGAVEEKPSQGSSLCRPNKGLELIASSVRLCLAPAIGGCDKLVQRRQRALRWQMDKPQSLKGCALFCNGMYPTPQQFEQFRTNYLRDIDEQLQRRRHMETRLHGRITGLDLEHILCGVADATRIEKGHALFHGIAGYLESVFDANAASALYKLLYRIIEARPTRPNYQQFFKGVFDDTVGSVPPGNKVGPKD